MADRRRRRALEDEGEETVSAVEKDKEAKTRPSECESEGDQADADVASEYESATEESRDAGGDEESEEVTEEEEETEEEETEEGTEEEDEEEEYTDDDVIIEGEEHLGEERQSGDGEEQPDKENVDDDEDKKNPAYVPRKGAFYEHDLRTGEDDEAPAEELKPKKKLWQDEGKWSHDRFREDLQAPKSREELIALYGYDIRASDKPPEAPPARKMRGRGRGRPQRHSKLSEFMEPQRLQPEPEPEAQAPRMAVIDTTDYGNKQPSNRQRQRAPPPQPPPQPEAFEDFDEDIDVPYMTTIDTSQSSADNYYPRGQRRRGGGPRGRRDRPQSGDYDRQNYGDRQGYRDRPSNRDRNGGWQGHPPQDSGYSQSYDARVSPRQDNYTQDFPSLSRRQGGYQGRDGYSQDVRYRDQRGQGGYRNQGNQRREEDGENMYAERNSYNRSPRGGPRGGFGNAPRGRDRKDRNDRPPRYSRMEREERPSNKPAGELLPAQKEFTNSSLRNNSAPEDPGFDGKNTQVAKPGAAGKDRQSSQDVVISNKENVQTISVTITNTTTERKSYTKERRGKMGGAGVGPMGEMLGSGDHKGAPAMIEAPPPQSGAGDQAALSKHPGEKRNQGAAGARQESREQTKPKRYSSQRQRNMMEAGYDSQQQQAPVPPPQQQQQQQQQQQHQPQSQQKKQGPVESGSAYYKQAVYPPGPPAPLFRPEMAGAQRPTRPPPPQDPAAFNAAMMQPPISFHLPVSSTGMPSPPHLMNPNMAGAPPGPVPVPISNASAQLIPAPYLAAPGVIYSAPPPPPGASAPYQVPLGYTSPPPAAPPPTLAQQPVASAQSQPEVHRGGTVYFPPHLQQPSSRSPARRPKVAIPIVDPTELKKKNSMEGPPTPTPEDSSAVSGERSHDNQQDIEREQEPRAEEQAPVPVPAPAPTPAPAPAVTTITAEREVVDTASSSTVSDSTPDHPPTDSKPIVEKITDSIAPKQVEDSVTGSSVLSEAPEVSNKSVSDISPPQSVPAPAAPSEVSVPSSQADVSDSAELSQPSSKSKEPEVLKEPVVEKNAVESTSSSEPAQDSVQLPPETVVSS